MGCFPSYSRQEWGIVLSLFAITFTTTLCASLQAPFYPQEAEKKGATATEYGLVFGIYELTAFIVSPFFGQYMGILGLSFFLKCGAVIAGISTILFGFLDLAAEHWTFISLSFLLRIIEAIGSAAILTSSLSIIIVIFSQSFARVVAMLEVMRGLGYIMGPTVGGYLFEVGGFKLPFLAVGIALLVTALLVCFTLPRIAADEEKLKPSVPMVSVLKVLPASLAAISVTTLSLTIGFLTAILEPHIRQFHLSPTAVGAIFIIEGGVYTFTAPIVGMLCDKRLNTTAMIAFGSIIVMAGFTLIGPLPFTSFNTTLPAVCMGLAIDGIGMSFIFVPALVGAIASVLQYGLPDDIATFAMISGIYNSAFSLGAFIGPSVAGILFDHFGFRNSTLFIFVIHALLVAMLSAFLCVEGWYKKKYKYVPSPYSAPVDSGHDQSRLEATETQALVSHGRATSYASTDTLMKLHEYNSFHEGNRSSHTGISVHKTSQ